MIVPDVGTTSSLRVAMPQSHPPAGGRRSGFGMLAALRRSQYGEAMIAPADIDRMSLSERLQTMELLWRSLASVPEALESPAWHGEVLSDRLSRVESGATRFVSLEEAKARLRQR